MRPCAFRPPCPCSGRTSDFSGSDRVISAKSATLAPRRPGVVGLYLRIAMSVISSRSLRRCAEQVDWLAAGGQGHDRALDVLALAEPGTGALALARPVSGVHRRHLHFEDLLDGDLDLRLVGVGMHNERVHVV